MSELYDRFSGALLGTILKIISDKDTAEDVLQSCMIKVWSNIDTYDPSKGRLFTWMINIARNQAIDVTRSRSFKKALQNLPIEDSVYVTDKVSAEKISADAVDVEGWLKYLPEDGRQLIDMAYFKGFTQDEISKTLNMPLGTVKTKIRSSILLLRKKLKI